MDRPNPAVHTCDGWIEIPIALFLAFFGLPRIYLFLATGNNLGFTAYLVGVAVFLWDKVPPVN